MHFQSKFRANVVGGPSIVHRGLSVRMLEDGLRLWLRRRESDTGVSERGDKMRSEWTTENSQVIVYQTTTTTKKKKKDEDEEENTMGRWE